jgi:hypothetical protein
VVHHRVVHADDLVIDLHRVRNQYRVLIHAQHSLREAGFPVSRGTVHEDRILRNDSRAELIQHSIAHHQVGKRIAQRLSVHVHLGSLLLCGRMIVAQRNRACTGVLRYLKTLTREVLPGRREHEKVIVAAHALHFHQLLRPHVPERRIDDRNGHAQGASQPGQSALPFEQHASQDQVKHQPLGNCQGLKALGDRGLKGGAHGCVGSHWQFSPSMYRQKMTQSLIARPGLLNRHI